MNDDFFSKRNCDRCGKELDARIMSWFTTETICMDCSDIEKVIKEKLREMGIKDAMEGCGYVPKPEDARRLNFHEYSGTGKP